MSMIDTLQSKNASLRAQLEAVRRDRNNEREARITNFNIASAFLERLTQCEADKAELASRLTEAERKADELRATIYDMKDIPKP